MPPIKDPTDLTRKLKLVSRSSNGSRPVGPEHPLDEAERLARELSNYDDRDEVTANIHVSLDSIHDTDPPAKKIRSGLVALGTGVGLALITTAVALLQRCAH
jgi:hypothetical protein